MSRKTIVTMVVCDLALLGVAAYWFFGCPCDRVPGGYLLGDESTEQVSDWSFANRAGLCQLQVDAIIPHSITLNCMAAPDGRLFISCSQCEGKYWSGHALEKPAARVRIEGTVYPVALRRATDAAELDVAWTARAAKTGRGSDQARPDHWWSFELTSRS